MGQNMNTHLFNSRTQNNNCCCLVVAPGGGEPLQPGAVCGGAGGQLCVHGLPQCDTQGDPGSRSLRCAAHHLPARRHGTLPSTSLFPFSHPTQVCDRRLCVCLFFKKLFLILLLGQHNSVINRTSHRTSSSVTLHLVCSVNEVGLCRRLSFMLTTQNIFNHSTYFFRAVRCSSG